MNLPDDGESVADDSDEEMLRLGETLREEDGTGLRTDKNDDETRLLDDGGTPCLSELVVVGLGKDEVGV